MIPLHQLLARFKGLTNTEKIKKEHVVDVILGHKIPITINQVSFNKKVIQIKAAPIIKTEIFLKKEKILLHINQELGGVGFHDIQ